MDTNTIDREPTVWKLLILGSALPIIGEPGIAAGFSLLLLVNAFLWLVPDPPISRLVYWRLIAVLALVISTMFVYGAFFSSWYAGR